MLAYVVRRLLLMIPTILGIMAVSFAIVQFVPAAGRARDRAASGRRPELDRGLRGRRRADRRGRIAGVGDIASRYRGSQGLDPKFIKELEKHTASTSRRSSASGFWCATTPPSISARATTATRRC